ncbi:DUF6879 family protein [Actinospica robiniae]|uniref:DUF6879 family protein n=1 Tax=Actinospica robiniae TaxID=304901 RepID=UPI000410D29E|nr:DUF6879 family protein [Actinospica robiniae]
MSTSEPTFEELLGACRVSAVHLEMRDAYMTDDPAYVEWTKGERVDGAAAYADWFALVRETVARGVVVRRLRVFNEPASDYIRFEHAITSELNVAAGERVRWLPRRQAEGLLLPANELWVFDGVRVRFGFFSPEGDDLGSQITEDVAVAYSCADSFNSAWDLGADHEEFELR